MLKKMLKKKVAIGSICLFVLLVANMVLGTFWLPIRKTVAEGRVYENIRGSEIEFEGFEEGQADKHFSTYGMSDDYVDRLYDDIERTYGQYVSLDGDFIAFDMEPFIHTYGNFLEDSYELSILSEEGEFEVRTLRMINQNMSVMNELVEEGYGYINDNLEIEFYHEDDYFQLWSVGKPIFRWNKVTITGDSDVAILVSIITLALRTIFHAASIESCIRSLSDDGDAVLVAVLRECIVALPSDIAGGIVGLLSDPVISILANSFSILVTLAENSDVILKVIMLLISIWLPSIVDGMVVLYNACKYDKGVEIKRCWIPWKGDKLGYSIKSI